MVKIKCSLKSWWRNSFCSLLKKREKSPHNNSFDRASYIKFTYVSLYMTMFGEVHNTNSFSGGGVRLGGDVCQKGQ